MNHPQTTLELPLSRAAGAAPLQRQLHARLSKAILDGGLLAGSRLPASRLLAHTLGIFVNRQIGRSDLRFEGLIA